MEVVKSILIFVGIIAACASGLFLKIWTHNNYRRQFRNDTHEKEHKRGRIWE
jgi:hypothetical protein